jgi:hypothetical protein
MVKAKISLATCSGYKAILRQNHDHHIHTLLERSCDGEAGYLIIITL